MIMNDKKDKVDNDIIEMLNLIATTGRSQGIFLLIFTQRPSVKNIPTECRANLMCRISSFQSDKGTSEMAVGDYSASELPDIKGRVIFKLSGTLKEVQAVFLDKNSISSYLPIYKKGIDLRKKTDNNWLYNCSML